MTTYERVTYRPVGAPRSKTVVLMDPVLIDFVGDKALTGVEVDREGTEIAPRGVDERRHIIVSALISKRTPLRMDNNYGELEEA